MSQGLNLSVDRMRSWEEWDLCLLGVEVLGLLLVRHFIWDILFCTLCLKSYLNSMLCPESVVRSKCGSYLFF